MDRIEKMNKGLSINFERIFLEYENLQFKLSNRDVFTPPSKSIIMPESAKKYISEQEWKSIPNCCEDCQDIFNVLTKYFSDFPECCELHKETSLEPWFKLENYQHLPLRILRQVHSTIYVINSKQHEKNSFSEIVQFIDYSVLTFGIPSIGADLYIGMLYKMLEMNISKHLALENTQVVNDVMTLLQNKLTAAKQKGGVTKFQHRIVALLDIYHQWIEIFPKFSFYETFVEDHVVNFISVFTHNPQYNQYSKLTKLQLIEPAELLQKLPILTDRMLSSFNSKAIIEEDIVSEKFIYKMNLMDEEHRLKQKKLEHILLPSEEEYVKRMYVWLEDEKKYYHEKEELMQKSLNIANQKSKRPLKDLTFLEFFHNDQKRVDLFFDALRKLGAIDTENRWIYSDNDNAICNCLEALFMLSKNKNYSLVNHSYQHKYSKLHKMVKTMIEMKCSYGNFKKWGSDINQINTFKKHFRNVFYDYLR